MICPFEESDRALIQALKDDGFSRSEIASKWNVRVGRLCEFMGWPWRVAKDGDLRAKRPPFTEEHEIFIRIAHRDERRPKEIQRQMEAVFNREFDISAIRVRMRKMKRGEAA